MRLCLGYKPDPGLGAAGMISRPTVAGGFWTRRS